MNKYTRDTLALPSSSYLPFLRTHRPIEAKKKKKKKEMEKEKINRTRDSPFSFIVLTKNDDCHSYDFHTCVMHMCLDIQDVSVWS